MLMYNSHFKWLRRSFLTLGAFVFSSLNSHYCFSSDFILLQYMFMLECLLWSPGYLGLFLSQVPECWKRAVFLCLDWVNTPVNSTEFIKTSYFSLRMLPNNRSPRTTNTPGAQEPVGDSGFLAVPGAKGLSWLCRAGSRSHSQTPSDWATGSGRASAGSLADSGGFSRPVGTA